MMKKSDKTENKQVYLLPDGLIRLNVKLAGIDQESKEILQKYGNVKRGITISRDIIVPKEMPLRSLHYVLQRVFGFQDSHEHMFQIFISTIQKLTGDKMENLLNLRGVIIHQETEEEDFFTLDIPMFTGGNFNKWMKMQYTAPYSYEDDYLEDYYPPENEADDKKDQQDDYEDTNSKMPPFSPDDLYYIVEKVNPSGNESPTDRAIIEAADIDSILESAEHVKLTMHSLYYAVIPAACTADDPDVCTLQKVRLGDLSILDGFNATGCDLSQVIERLQIGDVLALSDDRLPHDENWDLINPLSGLVSPQIVTHEQIQAALEAGTEIDPHPFADVLKYVYDFGDGWSFYISGSRGYTDLIEQKAVSVAKAVKTVNRVLTKREPVLMAADGDMLIEDSGNVFGFAAIIKHLRLAPNAVVVENMNDDYQSSYRGDWKELYDEEDTDDNGMTRGENLEWAISQGWHRNDYTNYSLL